MHVEYGERIASWRGGRDVTRKRIVLDREDIDQAVEEWLRKQGVLPDDLSFTDNWAYDANIVYQTLNGEGYRREEYLAGGYVSLTVDTATVPKTP